jgi:hypothetical protein
MTHLSMKILKRGDSLLLFLVHALLIRKGRVIYSLFSLQRAFRSEEYIFSFKTPDLMSPLVVPRWYNIREALCSWVNHRFHESYFTRPCWDFVQIELT